MWRRTWDGVAEARLTGARRPTVAIVLVKRTGRGSRPFQRCKVGPTCVQLGSMQLDRKSRQTSEINRPNITNEEN